MCKQPLELRQRLRFDVHDRRRNQLHDALHEAELAVQRFDVAGERGVFGVALARRRRRRRRPLAVLGGVGAVAAATSATWAIACDRHDAGTERQQAANRRSAERECRRNVIASDMAAMRAPWNEKSPAATLSRHRAQLYLVFQPNAEANCQAAEAVTVSLGFKVAERDVDVR